MPSAQEQHALQPDVDVSAPAAGQPDVCQMPAPVMGEPKQDDLHVGGALARACPPLVQRSASGPHLGNGPPRVARRHKRHSMSHYYTCEPSPFASVEAQTQHIEPEPVKASQTPSGRLPGDHHDKARPEDVHAAWRVAHGAPVIIAAGKPVKHSPDHHHPHPHHPHHPHQHRQHHHSHQPHHPTGGVHKLPPGAVVIRPVHRDALPAVPTKHEVVKQQMHDPTVSSSLDDSMDKHLSGHSKKTKMPGWLASLLCMKSHAVL